MLLKKIAMLTTAAVLTACATQTEQVDVANPLGTELYSVKDWMNDGSFTNGVEGPAVDKHGNLFAVNYQQQGTIGKVTGKDTATIFVKLPNYSIGNGIRFASEGTMYIADYVNHNVLYIKPDSTKADVFAHEAKMNQPNDLAIAPNGMLYASDPNWQNSTGNLWLIKQNQEVVLLEANMGTTNGVEVSPLGDYLYVNESVQRNVWRYKILADGSVTDKTLFYHFDDFGLDGMRCDNQGNLYIARYGAGNITVFSPKAELLREIKLTGEFPTNLAFGGKDGKTIFVTMQKRGAIVAFQNEFAGRNY